MPLKSITLSYLISLKIIKLNGDDLEIVNILLLCMEINQNYDKCLREKLRYLNCVYKFRLFHEIKWFQISNRLIG